MRIKTRSGFPSDSLKELYKLWILYLPTEDQRHLPGICICEIW